jgi:hypothetical protein
MEHTGDQPLAGSARLVFGSIRPLVNGLMRKRHNDAVVNGTASIIALLPLILGGRFFGFGLPLLLRMDRWYPNNDINHDAFPPGSSIGSLVEKLERLPVNKQIHSICGLSSIRIILI